MLTCKHCGTSNQFKARVIRGAVVELLEDGTWNIKQESQKFSVEPAQCLGCGTKLSGMEDIVQSAVECPDCKTMHDPATMIDGLCATCYAKKQRPDILNMTQEEMIRRLVELERMTKAEKIEVKEEKAAEAVAKVEEKTANTKATTTKTSSRKSSKAKDKVEDAAPQDPLADIEAQSKENLASPPENIDPSEQEEKPEAVHQEEIATTPDSVETNTPPVAPPDMEETPF